MAWQFTKRHQEALWYEQSEPGGGARLAAAGPGSIRQLGQPLPVREARQAPRAQPARQMWQWQHWLRLATIGITLVMGQGAQAESAPFVFEDSSALRIDTQGWESDRDHVVLAPAFIDVAPEVQGHISGAITPAPGSRNGLYKLGAGTLRLSGAASYQGGTHLLQGGLHVDGPQVFGGPGFIEAVQGTSLEYSPGTVVSKALTLRNLDVSQAVPADLYTPAAPPAGLEDAMAWQVESGTATHAGLLQGSLPFVKLGAGVLNISEDAMGYNGQARVVEGALAINEIFFGSALVGAGARLQGTGSLASARIQSDGTLSPGNTAAASGPPAPDIGTMAVTGDLHFEPGSRFEVEAAPTGVADFVWVGGKALLDGKVEVLAQEGNWGVDTAFPILSALGGFDGTEFAEVSSDLAFLAPSLEYGADTVTLTLKRNETPVEEVGETPDEEDVGRVIDEDADDKAPGGEVVEVDEVEEVVEVDEIVGVDEAIDVVEAGEVSEVDDADEPGEEAVERPKEPGIYDQIVVMDSESARQALKQLSGSWNASVLSSIWDDSRFLREAVLHQSMEMINTPNASLAFDSSPAARRLLWHGGTPPTHRVGATLSNSMEDDGTARFVGPSSAQSASLTPWVELFYSDQERDGRAGVPGDTRRVNGVVLGIASAVSTYWKMGAFMGAQESRLGRTKGAANADIVTTHLGLNLAGQVVGWRLALGAARSFHRIKSSRLLQAGSWRDAVAARYNGHTTQVFGEAARPMNFSSDSHRYTVAPFVGLAWVRTAVDGFTESGGPAALRVQPGSMGGWVSTLGLRAEAAVGSGVNGSNGLTSAASGEGKIYAQLAWHHVGFDEAKSTQAFRDSAAQTLFTSQGLGPVRQSFSLRLGLDASVGKASNVGFAYIGLHGRGVRDHGIGGWARFMF